MDIEFLRSNYIVRSMIVLINIRVLEYIYRGLVLASICQPGVWSNLSKKLLP